MWGDHDTNGVGQKAAAKLAKRAVEQGLFVKVILPSEPDTDWLDVLLSHGEEALRSALAAAPVLEPSALVPADPVPAMPATPRSAPTYRFGEAPQRTGNPVPELNKRHFVVDIGGKTYIATEKIDPSTGYLSMELGGAQDFAMRYANWIVQVEKNKFIPASQLWLTSPARREYEGVVFSPDRDVPNSYNLWRGFAVVPQQGDCHLFWQHVRNVICAGDEAHYTYFRKWLGHMFQRPAELPGVAIVIRGSQGVGKTFFVDLVGELLGPHYLMLTRMEQLTGRFTGHLKDALLVCANEAVWGGDKQGEGALKSMITDPLCTVEPKGKDLFQVRNYKRLIVTTNEQWAVPMSMQDRRFFVLEPSEEHREDRPYFSTLAKQMREGGQQALLYDLLHEELEGFDVRTKPQSPHGLDIKLRSSDPVVRWWHECLFQGNHGCVTDEFHEGAWNTEPDKIALYTVFLEYCTTHRQRTIDKSVFGKELRKMLPGYTVGEVRPRSQGSRGRLYTLPSLRQCREAFQLFAKAGAAIWEDATPEE